MRLKCIFPLVPLWESRGDSGETSASGPFMLYGGPLYGDYLGHIVTP